MKVESLEIYGFHMTNSEMWTYETASIRKGDPGAEDVNTLRTESLLWLEANHVSLRRFTAATPGYPCVSFICTAQWCTAPPEVCIQTVRWGWNVFLPFTHCDIWTPSKLNVRLFPARLSKHRRTCGESHASSQTWPEINICFWCFAFNANIYLNAQNWTDLLDTNQPTSTGNRGGFNSEQCDSSTLLSPREQKCLS